MDNKQSQRSIAATMGKHTPGPWFYQASSNTGFLINNEEFPYEDEESCIAYLPDIDYAVNIDENERDEHPRRFPEELLANTRLIAAALDMADALIEACETCESSVCGECSIGRALRKAGISLTTMKGLEG